MKDICVLSAKLTLIQTSELSAEKRESQPTGAKRGCIHCFVGVTNSHSFKLPLENSLVLRNSPKKADGQFFRTGSVSRYVFGWHLSPAGLWLGATAVKITGIFQNMVQKLFHMLHLEPEPESKATEVHGKTPGDSSGL